MLRTRQRLGKYRINKRIGEGGFSVVYRANDTIEGIQVALKIPHPRFVTKESLASFRKEVRISAALDHPNILPIKNASFIGRHFVIAYPLGDRAFDERLHDRMSARTAMGFAEQMLEAVAYAHEHRIIHCDIKPENFILFPENRLRLTDFGIAKLALRTRPMSAKGTGTLGYLAPEQAFGKPSFRSDIFSLGLILYRMFSGHLPEWPYEWPPPGFDRVRHTLPAAFISLLRRSMEIDERKRYRDGNQMLTAFRRLKPRTLSHLTRRQRKRVNGNGKRPIRNWRTIRFNEFQRAYGKKLGVRHTCKQCRGPIAENMKFCPWCGVERKVYDGPTTFPGRCKRCNRGMKRDWRYCPWCYGAGVEPSNRQYTDVRYSARCPNRSCKRKDLMPFMRYCPWCHKKVRKKWKIPDTTDKCSHCKWGVLKDYWDYCPWCGRRQTGR